ncbi:MAG: threonine--tRNA ligase [Candidatus Norongarragalinales archaeon]
MRLLQLHCDYVAFKPKSKALKTAEALSEEEKKGTRIEDVVVVFSSFEADDDERVLEEAAHAVEKDFRDVKAKTILVYPYAHLSNNLAPPAKAVALLEKFTEIVRRFAPDAQRAPFGYYKEFELKCKGHPLAELSKAISARDVEARAEKLGAKQVVVEAVRAEREKKPAVEQAVSESLKKEAALKSEFFVLTPKGEVVPFREFDYKGFENFKKFMDYETQKVRVYATEPPHIKLMLEHGIARYEGGSDAGNFSWPPKGRLIKKLLERSITEYCVDYGAMEVETPLMYDYEHPALKKYLHRFPARQYVVKSEDKEFFLRFAACFGMFLMTHDLTISYKSLPLKMYELTRYSFRREQSGELAGLKRVRALTMPDMHTFCADLEQAKREFQSQFEICGKWLKQFDFEFEAGFRAQTAFFNENKEVYFEMVKKLGKPALLELFDERYAYFVTKFEFNFVDCLDKASALSTVQIDVENAETYDISFTDERGEKKRPFILHASISGSIERVIYALLENEALEIKKGKTPLWPFWLAPTQVRLIPVSEKQHAACEQALAELQRARVRVDFDDRSESLDKKVRDAEREWIPIIAVIGARESASGCVAARIRTRGKPEQKTMSVSELADLVRRECEGKPFEKLCLPERLSKRVKT